MATPTKTKPKTKPKSNVVPIKATVQKASGGSSASALAQTVANDIRAKPYDYNRPRLAQFQRQSGIAADGLYGPESRRALQRAGIANPPPISFKGASGTSKKAADNTWLWLLLGGGAFLLLRKKH